MLNLFLVPQATKDLGSIFEYTVHKWSFDQAEIYQDLLFKSMHQILKPPLIGPKYPFKKGKYRKLIASNHIIFYRTEKMIVQL